MMNDKELKDVVQATVSLREIWWGTFDNFYKKATEKYPDKSDAERISLATLMTRDMMCGILSMGKNNSESSHTDSSLDWGN